MINQSLVIYFLTLNMQPNIILLKEFLSMQNAMDELFPYVLKHNAVIEFSS